MNFYLMVYNIRSQLNSAQYLKLPAGETNPFNEFLLLLKVFLVKKVEVVMSVWPPFCYFTSKDEKNRLLAQKDNEGLKLKYSHKFIWNG